MDSLELIKKSKENRIKAAFEKLKEDYIDIKALAIYSGLKQDILLYLIHKYKEDFDTKEINKTIYIKAKDEKTVNILFEEAKKYIETSNNE